MPHVRFQQPRLLTNPARLLSFEMLLEHLHAYNIVAQQVLTEYIAPSGDAPKPSVHTSYPVCPSGCLGRLELILVTCLFELCRDILSCNGRVKGDRTL